MKIKNYNKQKYRNNEKSYNYCKLKTFIYQYFYY